MPDNYKLPLSETIPRRMHNKLTHCRRSVSIHSYFDTIRNEKHRLGGCRSIGRHFLVGTQSWRYTQDSCILSGRSALFAAASRDGDDVGRNDDRQNILLEQRKEWIDPKKYSGAAWLNSVIDIARLSILLPLRYLVVMPLIWILNRLKDGMKSPQAMLDELKESKEGLLDAATVAKVFKMVGKRSPDLIVKVWA